MHRFFVPPEWIEGDSLTISGKQAHQLRNVLRLKPGDRIVVLDGDGIEYEAGILDITLEQTRGKIMGRQTCKNEPKLEITLYQALLKGSKIEMVLQKCTEVGVSEFVLFESERCVSGRPEPSRLDRWKKIVVEAAEQSRRGKVPGLRGVISFPEACEGVSGLAIMPWEKETARGLKEVLQSAKSPSYPPLSKGDAGGFPGGADQPHLPQKLSLFIGPEGGFSEGEVEFAQSKGIVPVSLGKRILRAETAGLVAAAAALYEYGEM